MPTNLNNAYPGTPGTTLRGGLPTPSVGGLITSFSLDNWDASSTRTLFRGGMPFKKGDIPSGSVPEIRRAGGAPVVAQFDERSTWSDGSLKFCVCHMRDTNIAGSGTQAYEVYSVTGAFNNTGATTLASVVASDALTVEFSSLTQYNGTTNVTRGAGAALAAFATHAGVATRVTKIHSGPVCEGWQVWGMAKDGAAGAGSEDAHLKTIWYVDVWKDSGGTVIDAEFACEVAQDWWGVASKFRLDYTATLKRNGATVQAYAGIQHPYHSHWMTVRMQEDNNHGKRHWVGAVPSLLYKPQKSYWVTTGLMPMLDPAFSPTANAAVSYEPMASLGHRYRIDDSGGYDGRGMVTNFDAKAFMRQTAADVRSARVSAFAGLHLPRHFRDERTRTRTSESADVANTVVVTLFDPKPSSAATFAQIPAPKYAAADDRTFVTYLGGYVAALGGEGAWSSTADAAHAVNYTGFMYLLEGERHMLETAVDMASKSVYSAVGNEFGNRPQVHWYGAAYARTEMSIPATQWSGISALNGQERSVGLSAMLMGYAAALIPDNDASAGYLRAWNSHNADYLQDCFTYTPPSLKASGAVWMSGNGTAPEIKSPWMIGLVVMGCAQNYLMTELSGYKTYGNMVAVHLLSLQARSRYDTLAYRTLTAPKRGDYAADNIWFGPSELMVLTDATVSGNRLTIPSTSLKYDVQNGDRIKFSGSDAGFNADPVPPEFPQETIFYAVNASGLSCDLALTAGGAPVTLTSGSYSIGFRCFGGGGIAAATFPPYLPNADDYPSMAEASFAYAESADMASIPTGTAAAMAAFLVNVNKTSYPAWKLLPI